MNFLKRELLKIKFEQEILSLLSSRDCDIRPELIKSVYFNVPRNEDIYILARRTEMLLNVRHFDPALGIGSIRALVELTRAVVKVKTFLRALSSRRRARSDFVGRSVTGNSRMIIIFILSCHARAPCHPGPAECFA